MVERFHGRISEVLATHRYRSGEDLKSALERYARLYNHELPQAAPGHRAPIEALKEWQRKRPDLFRKEVYQLTGLDTYTQGRAARRARSDGRCHAGTWDKPCGQRALSTAARKAASGPYRAVNSVIDRPFWNCPRFIDIVALHAQDDAKMQAVRLTSGD
jgi:hypothetical protein